MCNFRNHSITQLRQAALTAPPVDQIPPSSGGAHIKPQVDDQELVLPKPPLPPTPTHPPDDEELEKLLYDLEKPTKPRPDPLRNEMDNINAYSKSMQRSVNVFQEKQSTVPWWDTSEITYGEEMSLLDIYRGKYSVREWELNDNTMNPYLFLQSLKVENSQLSLLMPWHQILR